METAAVETDAELAARLARLEQEAPITLDDEKMLVTTRALQVRRELRECFGDDATYEPLTTGSEHALGFLRSGRVAAVVTRAPHRLAESGGWRDETVVLPGGTWHDELTGRVHPGGEVRCADVFDRMPVALLVHRP